jgi:hypothetical protein
MLLYSFIDKLLSAQSCQYLILKQPRLVGRLLAYIQRKSLTFGTNDCSDKYFFLNLEPCTQLWSYSDWKKTNCLKVETVFLQPGTYTKHRSICFIKDIVTASPLWSKSHNKAKEWEENFLLLTRVPLSLCIPCISSSKLVRSNGRPYASDLCKQMWIHECLIIKHTSRRDITLSKLVNSCQCFETPYCRHLQGHTSDPEDPTMRSQRSSATISQSRHRNISEDLNLQQRLSEHLKYRLVFQELRRPYCGWNSATHASIPPGKPPPPFPVSNPFMILENDLPACYNLKKNKKLWVVEDTVKREWAKPWGYCMQSKVECALPRGRIFRPCENKEKEYRPIGIKRMNSTAL